VADLSDSIDSATPPADELDELLGDYAGQQPGEAAPVDTTPAPGPAKTSGSAVAAARSEAARRPFSAATPAPGIDVGQLATWWWLPTLLIPMLGGMAAYYVLRDKRPLAAHVLFSVGLAIAVVASILFVAHARDLAAWTNSLQNPAVIVQPSTTITR